LHICILSSYFCCIAAVACIFFYFCISLAVQATVLIKLELSWVELRYALYRVLTDSSWIGKGEVPVRDNKTEENGAAGKRHDDEVNAYDSTWRHSPPAWSCSESIRRRRVHHTNARTHTHTHTLSVCLSVCLCLSLSWFFSTVVVVVVVCTHVVSVRRRLAHAVKWHSVVLSFDARIYDNIITDLQYTASHHSPVRSPPNPQ